MSGGRYGGYDSGSSSRRPSSWDSDGCTKVYVGNLGPGADKGEVARAFSYYGPLSSVWIARNPPGFAFVEFEDPRDAEDAVIGLDGKRVICGSRVRVELSAGRTRRGGFGRPPGRGGFNPSDRCFECGERGHYAYDCDRLGSRRRNAAATSRSRSRSRSGGRRRSRSRSRGRGRRTRSPSPRRRTRSPSPRKRTRTRSPSPRKRTRSSSPRRRSRSLSNKSASRGRAEPASKSRSRSRSSTPRD